MSKFSETSEKDGRAMGVLKLADGSNYEGEVFEGRQHGFGTQTSADGLHVFSGYFQFGERHGKGELQQKTVIYDQRVLTSVLVGFFERDELKEIINQVTASGPPRNPQCTVFQGYSLFLAWDKPSFDGGTPITSYLVYHKSSTGTGDFRVVAESDGTLTCASVSLLKHPAREGYHEFRVTALNSAGESLPCCLPGSIHFRTTPMFLTLDSDAFERLRTRSIIDSRWREAHEEERDMRRTQSLLITRDLNEKQRILNKGRGRSWFRKAPASDLRQPKKEKEEEEKVDRDLEQASRILDRLALDPMPNSSRYSPRKLTIKVQSAPSSSIHLGTTPPPFNYFPSQLISVPNPNEIVSLTLEGGRTYEGSVMDGKPHGSGKYQDPDGSSYEGMFQGGMKEGSGRLTWSGGTFTGQWEKDKRHGNGTEDLLVVGDRKIVQKRTIGVWENDKLVDTTSVDESLRYKGELGPDGKPNGQGTLHEAYMGSYMFEGDMRCGLRHGTGTLRWANGDVFTGNFFYDKIQGPGVLKCAQGRWEAHGDFDKDLKTFGTVNVTWTNGQRYSGGWARNIMNGLGTCHFTDGSCYEGEFKDGMFHGVGTLRKGNEVFSGKWCRGKLRGEGTHVAPDGSQYHGTFEDSMRHGEGALRSINGAQYEGGFRKGKRHGFGTSKSERETYVGEWANDKRHGTGLLTRDVGEGVKRRIVGMWKNDEHIVTIREDIYSVSRVEGPSEPTTSGVSSLLPDRSFEVTKVHHALKFKENPRTLKLTSDSLSNVKPNGLATRTWPYNRIRRIAMEDSLHLCISIEGQHDFFYRSEEALMIARDVVCHMSVSLNDPSIASKFLSVPAPGSDHTRISGSLEVVVPPVIERIPFFVYGMLMNHATSEGYAFEAFLRGFENLQKRPEAVVPTMRQWMNNLVELILDKRGKHLTVLEKDIKTALPAYNEYIVSIIDNCLMTRLLAALGPRTVLAYVGRDILTVDSSVVAQIIQDKTKDEVDRADAEFALALQVVSKLTQRDIVIDTDFVLDDEWEPSCVWLRRMDPFSPPLENCFRIVEAAKGIFSHFGAIRTPESPQFIGADDFLPIFIFVIIKSRAVQPFLILRAVWCLCHQESIDGESAYYLTMFESALHYILQLAKKEAAGE